ncbi:MULTISPECIES: AbrB family transcriptional regulator [Pseudanabaena]|uniref:Transcriptional regulator, AbrB family n=2 Tax=Pseudanabaena TaxID=1152 RepID=L8MTN3_9CYAN|nr:MULTISPECIES: AbrB family transcriptional regulator [Pseudanabaena]ELS31307.1 transcriptional regulator, AbrB family [Pseudanabaena biceps PCC 7429]MDG3496429.1 AbrB family transcriptional regulator [Pseudanabaena catenata USMAC16]
MIDTVTSPLTGKALLQKAKELNNLPKREQAKKCGYFTRGKDGVDRVNLTEFYEAVLAARGFAINPEQNKDGRGREPTFRVSVHKNGQIVIGSTYTRSMGLNEGDEFEIKLGYKHIHLIQLHNDQSEDNEE